MKLIPAFITNAGTVAAYYAPCEPAAAAQALRTTGPHGHMAVVGMQTQIDPEKIVYRDLSSPFLEFTPIEKEVLIKRER